MNNDSATRLRSLLRLFIILLLATAAAHATVPNAPTKLKAKLKIQLGGGLLQNVIELEWQQARGGDAPDGFTIYQSLGDSAGTFTLLDSTQDTEYDIVNPAAGNYQFYVKAYNADGESEASATVSLSVGDRDSNDQGGGLIDIHFVTAPIRKGTIGVEYSYDADVAVSDSAALIQYRLLVAPTGMVVDSMTGQVTWTPDQSGQYKVELQAYILDSTLISVTQKWVLMVEKAKGDDSTGENKWCATISGRVMADSVADSTNMSFTGGVIIATRVDLDSNVRLPKGHLTRTAPIVNGEYELSLQPGTYVLYAQGPGFLDEWYQDGADLASATRITVGCNDTAATADFSVMLQSPSQRFTVSGYVTMGDSTPVMAKVEFLAVDKEGFVFAGKHEWKGKARFTAQTDSNGYYEISLSNQFRYVARAVADADSLQVEYYNGVANIVDAMQLLLTEDRDSVNFSLEAAAAAQGVISGVVQSNDSLQAAIAADVVIFQVTSKKNGNLLQKRIMTVETDSTGVFTAAGLEAGEYVVLAIPSDRGFVPGYYVEAMAAVRSWRDATLVSVSDSAAASVTVLLDARVTGRGMAKLKGGVAGNGGTIKGEGHAPLGAPSLSGVLVMAVDADGQVVDYAFSDVNGAYEMRELGAETYTVEADKFEFEPYRTTVSLDYAMRSEVNVGILMRQSTTSNAPVAMQGSLQGAIHPNPVLDAATISFVADRGWADVVVIDPTGAEVRTTRMETINGSNIYRFDSQGLPNGVYFVRISSGGRSSVISAVVMR